MNSKQQIVLWGLGAYILGGCLVAGAHLRAVLEIIRYRFDLFVPVLRTVGVIVSAGIVLIWLLRDRKYG